MIGQNDADIFLNNDHFSEDVRLSTGVVIKGIYDIDEDNQFNGLAEGRLPSVLISNADYAANKSVLSHRSTVQIGGLDYEIETVEPYGADRAYTVLTMRFP